MAVATKHPEYTARRVADWRLCKDAYQGESQVKARGSIYLPKPSGYSVAGGHADGGEAAYASYMERAEFPDFMSFTVGAMIGIIHSREIAIELPTAMEYLREDANGKGNTLTEFHRQITRHLLVSGRFGVLADAPEAGGDPYLEGYAAPTVINWEDDGTFYVLDETEYVRDGFAWNRVEKYRVLRLDEGRYVQEAFDAGDVGRDVTPSALGGRPLQVIPFAVASAKDLGPDIETPPMIGVARAAKAIYQLSADYRLQLYMSGQETLVAINGTAPDAVGAGVVHSMYGSEGLPADLKYVSPTCAGIEAHLEAIREKKMDAVQVGARMLEQSAAAQESGAARKLRFRSETANLMSVAQVSCGLLERSLRNVALLLGQPEDAITVRAPDELLDASMTSADATALWALVVDGGMSWETYYERLQRGGVMSSERDQQEEYDLIQGRDFGGDAL